jgi:hypothetical protein
VGAGLPSIARPPPLAKWIADTSAPGLMPTSVQPRRGGIEQAMMLGDSDATTSTPKAADDGQERGRQTVFVGRLRPADTPERTIDRLRLHRLLDSGLTAGNIVVTAPAGSGKTTLLAGWASAQERPGDIAWLTLSRAERDPAQFLSHLVAAAESTVSGADALAPLRDKLASPSFDSAYVATLATAMAGLRHDVVLVLDDFHHVIGSDAESLFRRMLR